MATPNRKPVWACWRPFTGTFAQMPTVESLRRNAGGQYELVVIKENGIDTLAHGNAEMFIRIVADTVRGGSALLFWLEGHPGEQG